MLYRYRIHWLTDPQAALGPGRPLFARCSAEAISKAADLWNVGTQASALGYCVVDTEDGTVLWRQQHERGAVCRRSESFARLPACP